MRLAALALAALFVSATIAPAVMACAYKPTVAQTEIPKKQDGQSPAQSVPART